MSNVHVLNPPIDLDHRPPQDHVVEILNLCAAPMVVLDATGEFVGCNEEAAAWLPLHFSVADPKDVDFSQFLASDLRSQDGADVDALAEARPELRSLADLNLLALTFRPGPTSHEIEQVAHLLFKNAEGQESQTENVSLQAEALSDGSQAQAFVLDAMDNSVRRLQDALMDITTQAATTENRATQTMELARLGRESVQESRQALTKMGASAKQIEGLAGTIQGVARQTNLLALNAAIEAARVGEQGRGFSVIADQIRSLSTKAKGAADEVSKLLHTSEGWISESVQLGEVVDQGLGEIGEAASSALAGVAAIVSAVEEHVQGAVRTHQAVDEVRDISETNTMTADEIVLDCKVLSGSAHQLLTLATAVESRAKLV